MDAIAVLMPMFNTSLKHYYVIEGDLQSYFDTVHHRTLMKLLRRRLKDRELLDLLWKFLKSGVMKGASSVAPNPVCHREGLSPRC